MKSIHGRVKAVRGRGPLATISGLAVLLIGMLAATVAQASSVLIADTTLVSGDENSKFSFDVSGPGTVTIQLTNLDWPQALSSLSFLATNLDANQVLASFSEASPTSTQSLSFQIGAAGRYFADVHAVAGGPLDLGLYSFTLNFSPAAPVPLPSSGALLLSVVMGIFAWRSWGRPARGGPTLAAALSAP